MSRRVGKASGCPITDENYAAPPRTNGHPPGGTEWLLRAGRCLRRLLSLGLTLEETGEQFPAPSHACPRSSPPTRMRVHAHTPRTVCNNEHPPIFPDVRLSGVCGWPLPGAGPRAPRVQRARLAGAPPRALPQPCSPPLPPEARRALSTSAPRPEPARAAPAPQGAGPT